MAEETGYVESDEVVKLPLMISVTAPSTLPAGYTFEAYVNDDKMRPFTCEVVSIFLEIECQSHSIDWFIQALIRIISFLIS